MLTHRFVLVIDASSSDAKYVTVKAARQDGQGEGTGCGEAHLRNVFVQATDSLPGLSHA
jgi:hypothetical protein